MNVNNLVSFTLAAGVALLSACQVEHQGSLFGLNIGVDLGTATSSDGNDAGESSVATADRDHDGIGDDEDWCEDSPEDLDGVHDADGCPELDADGDGINDPFDSCPETSGANLQPDGCPPPYEADVGSTSPGPMGSACPSGAPPVSESCNAEDDDCDGVVDEGLGLGFPCTAGLGACARPGAVVCGTDGATECNAVEGEPAVELCNWLDDDCDGLTDEDLSIGLPCTVGVGDCLRPGYNTCAPDGTTTCSVEAGSPGVELCDGRDNDCDGAIDNGVMNACGFCGPVPDEVCNGLDDDCDGETDEGC